MNRFANGLAGQPQFSGDLPDRGAILPPPDDLVLHVLVHDEPPDADFPHQRLHDPGFFQFARPAADAVEPVNRRLSRPLVDRQQPHVQGWPGDLAGRRLPLEAIDQLGPTFPPAGGDRRQLPVPPQ